MPQQGIELRILGPFEMAAGGSPVRFGSLKQRMLMAHLTARSNRPVPVDQLVFALWGEAPPATVDTTLRSLVSRLRRLLASIPAPENGSAPRVVGQDSAYLLEVDPAWIDALRFEEDVVAGQRAFDAGDPLEAVRCFQTGLARWRGPALPELADVDTVRAEATRLNEERVAAMEALADAELAAGQPARAQATLEFVVAEHPLREPAWGRLMIALYRQGRQADALRVYQRARRLLVDQLGVEPGPDLRKVEQQVLAQSPELDGPGPTHNTVAFLFTDIEASTRRWEGDRQAMASDLARHDDLLRAEIDQVGGRVFTHTGDGLCASFPTAAAAVAAAIAGQWALQRQRWASAEPLRVRMVVHAGAAEARGDNWVGPPLNRTARLLALSRGGQVLCSRAAADLAGDDLPAGVRLVDLGEHRLADLARPEQVFGVEHPDLPGGCSVLASSGTRRTNLGEPVTSFLGRARELDELDTLLASARVLTLTGVGGGGKTRLATELARRCVDRYPDGVWLVELTSVRDGAAVAEEISHALGLLGGAQGRERALDSLREWLAARRLLLVLDNCEHLVEDVATVLEAVLPAAPGLSVLATSREVLVLPGEVSWTIPPLSLPPARASTAAELAASDAVELFCHRASSAQPAFTLSDANAAAVAQICRRLDGIPLALELAAARIRVLGAQQLAERLGDRFRVLAPMSRAGPRRHQTLQATMDWSWDLLPPQERAALARLSVFPADFALDAAEAVVGQGEADGTGPDRVDLVLRLVDKSLVATVADGTEMRYRLLETVRSYAAAKLAETGDDDAVRRAHCDHFLRRADRPAHEYWAVDRWFTIVACDEASYRAAIEWCLATGKREEAVRLMATYWFYAFQSNPSGGGLLLARCVAHPRPAPSPALVECLRALALLPEGRRGQSDDVEAILREALDMARALGDTPGENRVLCFLGSALVNQGRHDEGRPLLIAARDHFAAHGEPVAQSWLEHELGWDCMLRGDHVGARACFEAGLVCAGHGRLNDDAVDRVSAATLWSDLAAVGAVDGNADRAREDAARAVATARQLPIGGGLLMALCREAEVGILVDDDIMAAESLAELVATLRDVGDWHWAAGALEGTVCLVVPHNAEEAAIECRLLAAAAEVRRKLGEGAANAAIAERVTKRRAEIAGLLSPEDLAVETERGRQASSDEALRWALAVLRSRHTHDDLSPKLDAGRASGGIARSSG